MKKSNCIFFIDEPKKNQWNILWQFSFFLCSSYQQITLKFISLLVDSFVGWLMDTTVAKFQHAIVSNVFEMLQHREILNCRSKSCAVWRKSLELLVNGQSCAVDTCSCAVNSYFDSSLCPYRECVEGNVFHFLVFDKFMTQLSLSVNYDQLNQ